MDNTTKLALITLAVVIGLSLFTASVYASSWDKSPSEGLYPKKQGNISYHTDFNKHDITAPKSYGWQVSKVCGLELCRGEYSNTKQNSFLQNPQTNAPQTLGPYLGLEPTGKTDLAFLDVQNTFDGNFYIKGYFPSWK